MQLKKLCSTIHLQQSGSNENFTAAWIIHSNQGILEKQQATPFTCFVQMWYQKSELGN